MLSAGFIIRTSSPRLVIVLLALNACSFMSLCHITHSNFISMVTARLFTATLKELINSYLPNLRPRLARDSNQSTRIWYHLFPIFPILIFLIPIHLADRSLFGSGFSPRKLQPSRAMQQKNIKLCVAIAMWG